MALPTPSSRISLLRPTAVNTVLAEVREARAAGRDIASLLRGEPDLPTPEHIVAAAERALREGRTGYPDNQGEPALREAVAAKLARENHLHYSAGDEILITTGATLGIYAALAAALEPGDEVLLPEPIYDAYRSPIALAGGTARSIPAQRVNDRFVLDADAVRDACGPRSRVLLLNHPWNPTGTVFRRAELAALVAVAEQQNLLVLSDEIYEAIRYDDREFVSPAALSNAARARTIVINSFSKTYAMTGWRLGYCAGPALWMRAIFLVLQQASRGPATFVQDAGVAALNGSQECVEQMRCEYSRRRESVCTALAGLPYARVLPPEGGFFAMVDLRAAEEPSDRARRRLLWDHGVVVMHGAAYGAAGEGTLRISFAAGGRSLEQGLARLREGLCAKSE